MLCLFFGYQAYHQFQKKYTQPIMLQFQAISHLTEQEANSLLASVLYRPTPQFQSPNQNLSAAHRQKFITVHAMGDKTNQLIQQHIGPTQDTPKKQIQSPSKLLNAYKEKEGNERETSQSNDMIKLKEQCSRLRYEKIAMEAAMQKLNEQNSLKEEMISNLKSQLDARNRNQGSLRHTALPQY